jgi:c-di-GMP phosphodiesterase
VLTDGEDAFINVPESMLRAGTLLDVPTRGVVLELLEDAEDSEELRAAIAAHRRAGFRIALDDTVPDDPRLSLLDVVDLVKVDVQAATPARALRFIRELSHRGMPIVAEKVEDPQEFDRVVGAGAELVQGFFFTRPRAVRALRPLGLTPSHLGLLRAVALDEVDFGHIESLIRSDLTLTDRFLRLVDVAGGWREVESIRHGLVMLGTRRVHRWIRLLVLSSIASDRSPELMTTASVRARYCEELEVRRGGSRQLEAFALGMFSVLGSDAVVPETVLDDVPLTPDVRAALLGEPGSLRDLIDVALAAEQADWDRLVTTGRGLGLDPRELAVAHVEALRWSKEMTAAAA